MLDRCHGIDKHAGDQSRFGGPGHRIGPRPGERRQPRHGDVVTQDSGRGQQNPGCFRQWGHQIADQHGDVVPTRQAAGGMGGDERGEIAERCNASTRVVTYNALPPVRSRTNAAVASEARPLMAAT